MLKGMPIEVGTVIQRLVRKSLRNRHMMPKGTHRTTELCLEYRFNVLWVE
jgi:hypothetical protein